MITKESLKFLVEYLDASWKPENFRAYMLQQAREEKDAEMMEPSASCNGVYNHEQY